MSTITFVPTFFYDVANYQAILDGTSDDKAHIQSAIDAAGIAGGGFVIIPAIAAISGPLNLNRKNVKLIAVGPGSGLKALAGFSGAEMVNITADGCGVGDMILLGGPNTNSASNPALNGVEVTGARTCNLSNLQLYYINGWAIEIVGTSSVNPAAGMLHNIHMEHCAKGIHGLGNAGSNNVGQLFLSNISPEAIDNGDALLLEDINDIEIVNFDGAANGGIVSGSTIHIKGNCSSIFFSNTDVGMNTLGTASPTILIESGINGSPTHIGFTNGVSQSGNTNLLVSSGADIKFNSMKFKHANTDGVQLTGGGPITFEDCHFAVNNQSGGTAYDINSSLASGNFYVRHSHFETPVGSGAGSVTSPVNDTTHKGYFFSSHFQGTGNTPSLVFASGGTPQIVRGCPGYNPRGNVTPQTIGASPFVGTSSQHDITIYFTSLGDMTTFKIGGANIGSVPTVGSAIRVPARQTFEIDYGSVAPTYVWIAD